VDRIRDLVREFGGLAPDDQQLLLKLMWLQGQVDEATETRVMKRLAPFLRQEVVHWSEYRREIRLAVRELERALALAQETGA
jgi:hypothetical protein